MWTDVPRRARHDTEADEHQLGDPKLAGMRLYEGVIVSAATVTASTSPAARGRP